MKFNFLFATIVLCFFQGSAQAQKLHFRTDGYYFYDNKCDTIILTQMEAGKQQELVETLADGGITVGKLECVPEGQMVIMGGSEIEIFSFLTENGTCDNYSNVCWNHKTYKNNLLAMINKKIAYANGNADKKHLSYFELNKDNTFENYGSKERISGRLYRDSIVLTKSYPEYMGFNIRKSSRTYRFYKFDQCPPTRDKFIYVYKDPFKE